MKTLITPNLSLITLFASIILISCNPKKPIKDVIYTEPEDFNLTMDISQAFGYDSIYIYKGSYPISFNENKFGQLKLKVLKKYGEGNGVSSLIKPWKGHRRWHNGNHCVNWGFSCREKFYTDRPINCEFTLVGENEISIKFLDKVPFGEKGYELN